MWKPTFLVFVVSTTFISLARAIPRPDHVVIVVEENHTYSEVINAPYFHSLAQQGASFTQSFALTHPSEPNYLDFFSGSDQGVTDDSCPHAFNTPNLANELNAAGFTFGGYAEDLPSVGDTSCRTGAYVRRHCPWVEWQGHDWQSNQIPADRNMPLNYFPFNNFDQLPTVSFVIPNMDNDMHDGSVQQGDDWLSSELEGYVKWAKTHNSLLIVTTDEDDMSGDNRIATIFVGPMVKPGEYSKHIDHFNVLCTLEDMYGLPHAGNTFSSSPVADVWVSP